MNQWLDGIKATDLKKSKNLIKGLIIFFYSWLLKKKILDHFTRNSVSF
jgi:hypothetical protein